MAKIGICSNCETVYLYHHNLLISFSYSQFENFSAAISKIHFDDAVVYLPDNSEGLVLRTMHKDIRMVFDREEFYNLQQAVAIAQLQLTALFLINEAV